MQPTSKHISVERLTTSGEILVITVPLSVYIAEAPPQPSGYLRSINSTVASYNCFSKSNMFTSRLIIVILIKGYYFGFAAISYNVSMFTNISPDLRRSRARPRLVGADVVA